MPRRAPSEQRAVKVLSRVSARAECWKARSGWATLLPAATLPLPEPARSAAFGHPGTGGSLGLTDPEHRVAFGFVPNLRRDALEGDSRAHDLLAAVYDSL
ncbi:hypothetical protein [Nocardia asiatica]|uniref:hypothetical protein n=1 Tax=Nocardia asiatica TaxID=209252 RepID=UPI0024546510|nr:hypothetical protein [Nocardia asiatica]